MRPLATLPANANLASGTAMGDAALLAPFTSPVILFFVLGAVASALRSDLAIPEAMAKGMSLYLMAAIGLKGGVAVAKSGIDATVAAALAAGLLLSLTIPFLAYAALRALGRLDQVNAGAVAAHYGSVSVVTYVTATELLGASGLVVAGFMVAVLAVMETPAILSGLFLARRGMATGSADRGAMLHELFLNASVVLLLGSFAIGVIAGPKGFEEVRPLFDSAFKGVLCLFLLDMGLIAARRLIDSRALTWRLVVLAIALPLVNGVIAVSLGTVIGLPVADAAALGVLGASASYIAVPAAMRLALPEADPGIYLTMSLSITFPFNVVFGIALYGAMARTLAGI